ncbi:MAG: hypothetical protein JKY20_04720 [Alphaproteobacteria bacterium]|nr:hypothetical protein [Alphaproteobacteria bacterium]
MGIFVVLTGPRADAQAKKLDKTFSIAGFKSFKDISHDNYRLLLYGKLNQSPVNFQAFENGDFITHTGTFLYKGDIGTSALSNYYNAFDPNRVSWDDTNGHFGLILSKANTLHLTNDAIDAYAVYRNQDGTVYSNSFLAVLECVDKPRIDTQGCYEYAWSESVFGGKTFVKNIERVPPNTLISISRKIEEIPQPAPIHVSSTTDDISFEDAVTEHSQRLQALFSKYATNFKGRLRTALSGGYDSRLILGHLLDAGVTPDLFVFGRDDDPDVRVALTIAKGENIPIEHIDKGGTPPPPPEEFAETVERNFIAFDGWKFSGIFDHGADLSDRLFRSQSNTVMMNGSVGEIYRNFYYLPDKTHTDRDIAQAFYARYSPAACTSKFLVRDFEDGLMEAMRSSLQVASGEFSRSQVEALYPLFRGRYWSSRDISINQRFGWMLFPFLEPDIVQDTPNIPLRYKNSGRFEAALIHKIHPRLAAYPSVYGHGFHEPPSLGHRFSDLTSSHRPMWLRKNMYRLKTRHPEPRPIYLTDAYLKNIFDVKFPIMKDYFHINKIFSSEVFNRISTMEYIFQKYNIN